MIKSKGISYRVLKAVLYSLYLFIAVFILLEIALRLYNPFQFRIKADRIVLPANHRQVITNSINPKLDSVIINTRNALGFRGPDTPADFSKRLSIVTVGGSTTECRFLSDDKTWPHRVGQILEPDFNNVWVNNAGLDGHSTFGHQLLLEDYLRKLHPKIVLFLTGVNDIENDGPSVFDKQNTRDAYPGLLFYLYKNSEVLNAAINLWRGAKAQKFNNTTQQAKIPGELGELNLSEEQSNNRLAAQQRYLAAYAGRLATLADSCKAYNIHPVFITQPCLYGEGIDSVTKVDLAKAKVEEQINGKLLFELLTLYNNEVKRIGLVKDVPVIDLAYAMPRNSLYYYDQTHFTNEGAELVAHIIAAKLEEVIRTYYLQ